MFFFRNSSLFNNWIIIKQIILRSEITRLGIIYYWRRQSSWEYLEQLIEFNQQSRTRYLYTILEIWICFFFGEIYLLFKFDIGIKSPSLATASANTALYICLFATWFFWNLTLISLIFPLLGISDSWLTPWVVYQP